MIKLRMMGTPEELQRFRVVLLRMEDEGKITIQSLSAMYANKDTEIFFRMYAEIKTARKGKKDEREEDMYHDGRADELQPGDCPDGE